MTFIRPALEVPPVTILVDVARTALTVAVAAVLAIGAYHAVRALVGPTSTTYTQPACQGGAAGWDPDQPATCHPTPPTWSQENYR